MSEERMHLEDAHYDPFYASQHVVRYEILRPFCEGKVILDVACGEGYGSALLSRWGAKEVVGVDVSAEAITNASKLFASETVSFIKHDAHLVDELLKPKQFDIVACFETIEHLKDPAKFLYAIKKLLNKKGIIVISCPNEKNDFSSENDNPYHLAAYSFQEFQSLTEKILGKASGWLFGTPAQGMINFSFNDSLALKTDAKLLDITEAADIHSSSFIAPASHISPSEQNCLYFVGMWGATPQRSSIVSPVSYPAFISPWVKIEHLEKTLAARTEAVETLSQRLNQVRSEASTYKAKVLRLAKELNFEKVQSGIRFSASTPTEQIQQLTAELEVYRRSKFVRAGRLVNRLYSVPIIGHALRLVRKISNIFIR